MNTYSFQCPSWWKILTLSLCHRIQTSDANPGNEAALNLPQAASLISCGICPPEAGTKKSDECKEAGQQQPPPIILPKPFLAPLWLTLSFTCYVRTANTAPLNRCDCDPWTKAEVVWWEAQKGVSLPVVTPPAPLEMLMKHILLRGVIPKGCSVAGAPRSITWSKRKISFSSRRWGESVLTSQEECLMGQRS